MKEVGQIAAVLSDREVAFNVGVDSGVQLGDIATAFEDTDVSDPETGESLGVVRRPSVRFQIIEVQPKLSVGRTYELSQREVGIFALSSLAGTGEVVRITEFGDQADWRTIQVGVGREVVFQRPKKEATQAS